MAKLIIFDWDDVFTRGSTKGYFNCYHNALESVGVRLDPEEERRRILAKWGTSAEEELAELLKENPGLVKEALKNYEAHLMGDTYIKELSMIDGAVELLGRLKEKYILCIATGIEPTLLKDKVMPRFKVPNVFRKIISAYDVEKGLGKPNPFMINQILAYLNMSPADAVFVGDAKNDVLMAFAAKVTPIVVLTGHLDRKQAEKLGVKHIIEDVAGLELVLDWLS